jgi:hypothetical protein
MPLRYRYTLARTKAAVVPLGGRWVRPKPLVHVSVIGPSDTYVQLAYLDTGSDDTLFPESVAARVGLDLAAAPSGAATVVGMGRVVVRYAQVRLRLASANQGHEWPAWVGFTPSPLRHSLLGFAGCLQFFTATFHGDLEEVELAVNRLYPGT